MIVNECTLSPDANSGGIVGVTSPLDGVAMREIPAAGVQREGCIATSRPYYSRMETRLVQRRDLVFNVA